MLLVSWNVNGLRACMKKGFAGAMQQLDADIICLQEIKMERGQAVVDLPHYQQYWNSSAARKGYSGTAVFSRCEPLNVTNGIGTEQHDKEGRVITLEYPDWTLVNVYTPNSQEGLVRLPYRLDWENAFQHYLRQLDTSKPVIVCGDMNVAHQEIDLAHPKANRCHSGFTDEERSKMTELLASGFADTFRSLYPDAANAYSWWSYRRNARERNIGWRIDYFLVSQRLLPDVADSVIYSGIFGSDHCPVGLVLKKPHPSL
ncbi:MAG: exodeoxyribonuclease III [Planctomycetaceae bacterium]|jgi:exodeoxyribonuclease-3|nr:exodeoxyribonuclease III [Planctomycetaceae bacterium]